MFNIFKTAAAQPAPVAAPTKPVEPELRSFDWFVKQADNLSKSEYYLTLAKKSPSMATEKYRRDYDAALDQALDFGGREDYMEWVTAWKAAHKVLVDDARRRYQKDCNGEWLVPKYYKETRRMMYMLRAEGKRRSWAKKQAAKNAS